MTLEELDELAFQNKPIPEPLGRAERRYFLQMRSIYTAASMGVIDARRGSEEKRVARQDYENEIADFEFLTYSGKRWAKIEEAGRRYRKNKTIENADAFMDAVYGTYPTKEEKDQCT